MSAALEPTAGAWNSSIYRIKVSSIIMLRQRTSLSSSQHLSANSKIYLAASYPSSKKHFPHCSTASSWSGQSPATSARLIARWKIYLTVSLTRSATRFAARSTSNASSDRSQIKPLMSLTRASLSLTNGSASTMKLRCRLSLKVP